MSYFLPNATVTNPGALSALDKRKIQDVFDPRDYGAKGVDQEDVGTTGSITSGTTALSVASADKFEVGDYIAITGADTAGAKLGAQIVSIDGTDITISVTAVTSVTDQLVEIDDAPAFAAAFTDTIDYGNGAVTFADGFGTMLVPPCTPGWAWNFATATFSFALSQSGPGTGSALRFSIQGSGAAGPIRCATGATRKAMVIEVQGLEWACPRIDGDLYFVTSQIDTNGPQVPDCKTALEMTISTGQMIIDTLHCVGVWGVDSAVTLGGKFTLQAFHDGGCTTGPSGLAGDSGSVLLLNQPQDFTIGSYFGFGEFLYLGHDNEIAGLSNAAIGIIPSQGTWGPSTGHIGNLSTSTRTYWAVYYIPTGIVGTPIRGNSLVIDSFHCVPSGIGGGIVAASLNHLEIRSGNWRASGTYPIVRAFDAIGTIRIIDVDSSDTRPWIKASETDPTLIEVIDTPLASTTNTPCGILLSGPTGAPAFITTAGVTARVRASAGDLVANTLSKFGSTDGQIDQLGTADNARLSIGVVLDACTGANQYVRNMEQDGQQVHVKTDGATTLAPGDIFTASGASAGRIKKTTTGGDNTVGNSLATVAATPDLLVNMIWRKSQY